jgi:hypothetical protein
MEEKVINLVDETVKRIKELAQARLDLEKKNNELNVHERDLESVAKVLGVDSKDYLVKKNLIDMTTDAIKQSEEHVEKLTFKKSELKPVLDIVTEEFQNALKSEQETEYEITLGANDERGFPMGKRAFTQLMTYLNERVEWTPKTAAQLMVLVANMKENETHVKSKNFDNVIKLRSSNVLVLYHSILENMSGKGYNTAKDFLTLWANCGQDITNAVREVHKIHESTRELGSKLNLIEDEFEKSFDDLPHNEETEVVSTKEEVAPEV